MTPILSLKHLGKRFGSVLAADDISLDLYPGEVLALLGENGAGKTTLMNMLFGHYTPDTGHVELRSAEGELVSLPAGDERAAISHGIGMVHQHFSLAENLSVIDNVLLGAEPLPRLRRRTRAARERLQTLIETSGLHVPLDARVGTLSIGERQRVEILKALYRDARILVLDEPTAVLTPQEADALFVAMREMVRGGLSVIFISHKLREVRAFSDRIAVLRLGRKVGEMRTDEAEDSDVIRMMVGEDLEAAERTATVPGAARLTLDGISVEGDGPALRDVGLTAHASEIIGIAGVSGNGQSTLARVISGLCVPDAGTITSGDQVLHGLTPRKAQRAGIGRVPEDRHHDGIVSAMSVAENLVLERLGDPEVQSFGFLRKGAIADNARRLSADHDIRGPGITARASLLSGGNIQKLILARVLDTRPDVVLANQPTRGLDFKATAAVHQRLFEARDRGAAVILISEDLDEILRVADRILVMHDGRLTDAPDRNRAAIGRAMAGQDREMSPA